MSQAILQKSLGSRFPERATVRRTTFGTSPTQANVSEGEAKLSHFPGGSNFSRVEGCCFLALSTVRWPLFTHYSHVTSGSALSSDICLRQVGIEVFGPRVSELGTHMGTCMSGSHPGPKKHHRIFLFPFLTLSSSASSSSYSSSSSSSSSPS